jgi:hypoxanthine phosphoribosyltransferase
MDIKIEELKVLFSEEQLQTRIRELAEEMNNFYNGEEVIAVCVLKGAVFFAIDLVKNLNMPLKMEFIRLSSYGSSTTTSGKVNAVDIK